MFERDPRKFAEECLSRAHAAVSDRDKVLFWSMAQEWLAVAQQREIAALRQMTSMPRREEQVH